MYEFLLILHSWSRWIIMLVMPITIVLSLLGWQQKTPFGKLNNALSGSTMGLLHLQLLIGAILLYIWLNAVLASGLTFGEIMKIGALRFFAVEHNVMMIIAIIIAQIGRTKSKRKSDDNEKHKTIFIWFGIAFLIILFMIPFALFHAEAAVNRPLFRF